MKLLRTPVGRAAGLAALAAIAAVSLGDWSGTRAAEPAWLTIPGGSPMFAFATVAPGDTGSATITVTNPQPFPVNFSIAVTGLANDDNGCNGPERASGDTTCGGGGGELQSSLRLQLMANADDRTVASGTVDQWAAAPPAVDAVVLSGYESRTYRVGYELPMGTSNKVQSDLVSFTFEMRLDQAFESLAAEPPAALVDATTSLPHTGAETDALVMVSFATVVVGFGLWAMSTGRRRSQ